MVAALFLITTIVLFAHLQSLGTEEDVLTAELQESSESSQVPEPQQMHNNQTLNEEAHSESHSENVNANLPTEKIDQASSTDKASLDDVHIFYYPWYANVETDGKWNHWDHHILPHWNDNTRKQVFPLLLPLTKKT